jgi:hypothetical protein
MTERDRARDAERLSEETAQHLLARASELEAARGAELSVADLREAARQAGIEPGAFEQALAELRERELAAAAGPVPSRPGRLARLWPAARATGLAFGGLMAALILAALLSRLWP